MNTFLGEIRVKGIFVVNKSEGLEEKLWIDYNEKLYMRRPWVIK